MQDKNINYKRLVDNLEYLKLKQILIHLDKILLRNDISLIDSLLKLTDYEVESKRIMAATQMKMCIRDRKRSFSILVQSHYHHT